MFTTAVATLIVTIIRALPLIFCFRLGEFFGLIVWVLLPGYRRLAKQNLSIAFGEKLTSCEIDRLTRKNFTTLGANIICSIKIPAMSEEAIRSIFTIENQENWNAAIDHQHGHGTVVALSHFGNWELNAQLAIFAKPRSSGAIYQPLRNRSMDDLVNRDRRSRGVKTFDRKRDLNAASALLREGGMLGVLIDQHAGDAGIWIPFFNKLASTSPLAATLAQRTNSLLVHATVRTVGPARWSVLIKPTIPTQDRSIAEITYELGCQLAEEIERSPADWFWVHNRWKLPKPAFLLARVKRGLYLPADFQENKTLVPLKLLVRSPNWLGDACMAIPAVRAMKQGRPDLHLTILTPAKLSALWRLIPEVDEVIEIPPKASPWKVARILRSKATLKYLPPFDVALVLPNSPRSALEVWLAGIPRRIGRLGSKGRWRKGLINQPIPESIGNAPSIHEADQYLAIAHWLGASPPPSFSSDAAPIGNSSVVTVQPPSQQTIQLNRTTGAQSDHFIQSAPPQEVGSERLSSVESIPTNHQGDFNCAYSSRSQLPSSAVVAASPISHLPPPTSIRIGLCAGAEYGSAKRWPAERFRAVMDQLLPYDIGWVLLGTSTEIPLATSILRGFSVPVENHVGKTSLAELIEQIRGLDILLTNDTGSMHLAALFGIPVVAIFGSTEPMLTGPRGPEHTIIRHQVSCSPCFLRECPIDFRCMRGITPEEVAKALIDQFTSKQS
ncbi:MAG: hypothetical protein A3F67_05085 [Verrucomicrobia bacterium RIFCSPHIGHO2_12_FULL_41_10]|nr:MAG: hypothetical protein A3F67_05085 [Verrucomicrobia bacterium RIFCSPHIGHO2_12_FULL_41_10]